MIQNVQNIQNMMRELVLTVIEKFNQSEASKTTYDTGVAGAYCWALTTLYNQAKLFRIPLNYLSLHTLDPDKAFFSNKIISFDRNLKVSYVEKEEHQSSILHWMFDTKLLIEESYKNCLSEAQNDPFYQAAAEGYREVLNLMEKYGIDVKR